MTRPTINRTGGQASNVNPAPKGGHVIFHIEDVATDRKEYGTVIDGEGPGERPAMLWDEMNTALPARGGMRGCLRDSRGETEKDTRATCKNREGSSGASCSRFFMAGPYRRSPVW